MKRRHRGTRVIGKTTKDKAGVCDGTCQLPQFLISSVEFLSSSLHFHIKTIDMLLFHSSYPSGDTYEGQWKNSVRHGEGTMKWIQLSQQYSGQWQNGVQVCQYHLFLVLCNSTYPGTYIPHCHL